MKLFFSILLLSQLTFCSKLRKLNNHTPLLIKRYDLADILLEEEDKREILRDIKTIYAPEGRTYMNGSICSKKKRDLNHDRQYDEDLSCPNMKRIEHDEMFPGKRTIHKVMDDENDIFSEHILRKFMEGRVLDELNISSKLLDFTRNRSPNNSTSMFSTTISQTTLTSTQASTENDIVQSTTPTTIHNIASFWKSKLSTKEIRTIQSGIMQKYMNPSIDPCTDFYEFACGNWKSYFTIPPDRATYDTFEMVRESLDLSLKYLLEEIPPTRSKEDIYFLNTSFISEYFLPNDKTDAVTKARWFYISCMNEEIISRRGDAPLRKILRELGNWPIITPNWNDSKFDLIWLLARLRLLNNDVLIAQWVGPDMKNSNEHIVHIDQTTLGLPSREYYLEDSNPKYIMAYRVFILTVVNLMGDVPENAEIETEKIIQFEMQLAQIMASPEERRNISDIYLRTDIASLTLYFPQFDWKSYFDIVLGKHIDLRTPVACYCARYLHELLYLLSNTNPRTLQNYLIWRFVRHRTNNLDQRFLDAKQRFYYILFGREKNPPRWQFCVSQVNSNMGMAIGSLFVRKYFDQQSKTDTIEMTKQLQDAFKQTLLENTWLDNSTKEYAQMKLDYMDLKIGFPDFILNDTELGSRYYDVEVHQDYFFENILVVLRHLTRVEQRRLGSSVNRTLWSTPPAVVNAYYSRNKNQIMFPAGMLQPPFYNRHFPKALNFGGIGVVIGHEITHGFDDKGRLFDHEGNLHMWWRESSIERFYEKSQCMIDQYGQYVLPEIRVSLDGYLTQGENIADNGGLKQAYRAYETWLVKNPNAEEYLPGLNLTNRQLFFLNFAQVWCGQQRIEAAKSRMKTSVHSPGIFRVIGVLSNSEDFSKAFNCPKNSPMNPEYKCVIW
ncbi:unnamed protein product [Phaedon cochleariae]|uniref:Neprilysin-4-like n=1 Tax=Phaedon cochleariae TaxID=80249 RepID=A0A9P0DKS9_PHACE|nr:unnamed protein product [Phaedon cochleariae]